MVLLTGMRQGGAGYLALDVTNPDAGLLDDRGPYPKLPWEFTHAKLGQAWSDEDRRVLIGGGLPSSPRVTAEPDSSDDVIVLKTSKGQVLTIAPPTRDEPKVSLIYWRQRL
jgi:Tfp pilus tip-associated adhesin PilY1